VDAEANKIMKSILIIISLFIFTNSIRASDINIKIGDSLENLLESEGDATVVEELIDRGTSFVRFYYQDLNMSFIINKETDYICDIAIGVTGGNCFICEQDQTSEMCP
jgi:hypothetical protein